MYDKVGIYGILNKINGKVYVGKTMNSFGNRRDCHFSSLNSGRGVNNILQNAWNKYGQNNFEFIILHECVSEEDKTRIDELEKIYIKKYKDVGMSYNISDGGDGGLIGRHLSAETKKLIGEKNRIHMAGRKLPDYVKSKMSESQKKRYQMWSDNDRREFGRRMSKAASGYKWSYESKNKLSKTQSLKPNSAKYDIEIVRLIRKMYEQDKKRITEISDDLGINRHTVYLIATYRRWKNAI